MITNLNLDEISRQVDMADETTDEEGNKVKLIRLGTVFELAPSGKYWTGFACGNMTGDEMQSDSEYFEELEAELEKRGMFMESGPDPTDVFVGKVIEKEGGA